MVMHSLFIILFLRLLFFFEKFSWDVTNIPLSTNRSYVFYIMRNDALDRFGMKLEKRYTRKEIQSMMETAGLENVVFSPEAPFWVALGYKKQSILRQFLKSAIVIDEVV